MRNKRVFGILSTIGGRSDSYLQVGVGEHERDLVRNAVLGPVQLTLFRSKIPVLAHIIQRAELRSCRAASCDRLHPLDHVASV